jgi:hypothetical protein
MHAVHLPRPSVLPSMWQTPSTKETIIRQHKQAPSQTTYAAPFRGYRKRPWDATLRTTLFKTNQEPWKEGQNMKQFFQQPLRFEYMVSRVKCIHQHKHLRHYTLYTKYLLIPWYQQSCPSPCSFAMQNSNAADLLKRPPNLSFTIPDHAYL